MNQTLLSQQEHSDLVGPAIHLLRQRLNLRQRVIAERAAIPLTTYAAFESGRHLPTDATLLKVLGALQADPATLEKAISALKGLAPVEPG